MKSTMSLCALLVGSALSLPVVAEEPRLGFAEAEEFVHGNLYSGMIQVWGEDRQAWNALLNVHACGGDQQQEKLALSYQKAQPLFSQSMLNLASSAALFESEQEQAILSDVAQTAYRLFSASYAHGYARQVQHVDTLDPGIHNDLCGVEQVSPSTATINYAQSPAWQLGDSAEEKPQELAAIQQHALYGYSAFNRLLKQQYESFDALVYSHAYQNTDAYEVLFFQVNRYENVQAYQAMVDELAQHADVSQSQASDFAYLVLSSGYHWGTMSVLAMLEEEFPRLHAKAQQHAATHIEKVTQALSNDPSAPNG